METNTNTDNGRKNGNVLGWAALIIAIGGMIFALLAYNDKESVPADNNTGNPSTDYQEDIAALRIKAAELEARTRLAFLEAKQAVTKDYTAFEREVDEVREDLAEMYVNAKLETSARWADLSARFDALQAEIQVKSASALESLQSLISRLSGK